MMKARTGRMIAAFLFVLIFLLGCAVSESYRFGQDLSKEKRWDDAIIYFKKALEENPDSQEYKDALQNAKTGGGKNFIMKKRNRP